MVWVRPCTAPSSVEQGVPLRCFDTPLSRATIPGQPNLWWGQLQIPLGYPDGTYNVNVIARDTLDHESQSSNQKTPLILQREMQSTAQPKSSSILGQLTLPGGGASLVLRLVTETRDFIQNPSQNFGAVRVALNCNHNEVPFSGGYVIRSAVSRQPLSEVTVWENFPIEKGWQVSASHKYPSSYRMSVTVYVICAGVSR